MLFNTNDNNQPIHSGNYEEYFILYMDNELNDSEMKMVDEFLAKHPELQAEFDLLLSTKLPDENFVFDKNALLADSMKLNAVDENLLLLVDNELPAEQIPALQQRISSDKDLQVQYNLLLKTKLDASEIIPYPNKKELYHRTGGIITMKPWLRVAAAAVVIAIAGVLYFNSERSASTDQPKVAIINSNPNTPSAGKGKDDQSNTASVQNDQPADQPSQLASTSSPVQNSKTTNSETHKLLKQEPVENTTAYHDTKKEEKQDDITAPTLKTRVTDLIASKMIDEPIAIVDAQKSINNSSVTSALQERNTNTEPVTRNPEVDGSEPSAPAPSKSGSLKGFLRKATRVIEKRTGIASSSDDDREILIGALALKVK